MLDLPAGKIVFSGAKRPFFYITRPGFFEIKGDRKPIGGHQKETDRSFTNHEIDIDSEIAFYLTTDGFVDQNDSKNKKYGSRRLKQFLREHAHLDMAQQKAALLVRKKQFSTLQENTEYKALQKKLTCWMVKSLQLFQMKLSQEVSTIPTSFQIPTGKTRSLM